ncbi:MAG: firA, partial [Phenylobacterium sp.]|nr:firA [Phenylobacterium sp.]
MPDPRFFEELGPVLLGRLAAAAGAELTEPAAAARPIRAVAILSRAGPETVTFLADRRHADTLAGSRAGACFVTPKDAGALPAGCVALLTPTPQAAYAAAAQRLHRPRAAGVQAIAADVRLADGVRLAPGVVIGPGVQIGSRTEIGANTVIGPGVTIGRNCQISGQVTIGFAMIGDRVKILAGA